MSEQTQVQHIFLVEFDILVGSVVKVQYPNKCNFAERYVANALFKIDYWLMDDFNNLYFIFLLYCYQ